MIEQSLRTSLLMLSLRTKKRRYTPIYSKMQQRLQAEISYVKADDESILSYGEEDNADRRNFCLQD